MDTKDNSKNIVGMLLAACIHEAILHDINEASFPTNDCNKDKNFYFDATSRLPDSNNHMPPRKIDLLPFQLKADFERKFHLYFASSALNSLAMAINSGSHIILTGPPGCGKSELATKLPSLANQPFILCTASPDWTTNELIGRYMPAIQKGGAGDTVLEFVPGFFLQAIQNNQWLVIDELNRADIDSCFGILFSVLAGQRAILPYQILVDMKTADEGDAEESNVPGKSFEDGKDANTEQGGADGGDSAKSSADKEQQNSYAVALTKKSVGICTAEDYIKFNLDADESVKWYQVPNDFRILCTMNDSDASMLNRLSFALQRRFSVIRIESPGCEIVRKYIKNRTEKLFTTYTSKISNDDEKEVGLGRSLVIDDLGFLRETLNTLFASDKNKDLLQLRVVGFGQMKDVISMTIEGLSYAKYYNFTKTNGDDDKINGLVLTLLANGVVMKVYPQLTAFIHDKNDREKIFTPAMKCIQEVFVGVNYHASQAEDRKLTIIKDDERTLLDYLKDEMRLLFRSQHFDWETIWESNLKEVPQEASYSCSATETETTETETETETTPAEDVTP